MTRANCPRRTFLSLSALGTAGLLTRPAWAGPAGPELRLGAAFGFTGLWSDWSRRNRIGLEIAVDEINGAGGVDGVPLKFILEDTGSKPAEAASLIRKLASDDRVLAILGPFSSSECEVAFPVGNQLKVPMIAQASSKPGVSKANRPYAFRNTMDEMKMVRKAVPVWARHYGIKSAVVVHDIKEAVAHSLGTKVFPAALKQAGITIVNEGAYVTFTTKDLDFSAQVTRLRGMQFDGIAFGGVHHDAANFLKEARRQGVKQPLVVAPCTFWPGLPDERVQAFVRRFRERAQKVGLPPDPDMFDANVFDEVYLLAHVIKTSGVTNRPEDLARDRDRIMQALAATREFPGLAGKFGFDADGDGVKPIYVVKVTGGRWASIEA
jgi:branched-chain amino acid transport system substrate-binding protein